MEKDRSGPAAAGLPALGAVTVFDNDGERLDGQRLRAEIMAKAPGAGFQDPPTWGTLTL